MGKPVGYPLGTKFSPPPKNQISTILTPKPLILKSLNALFK